MLKIKFWLLCFSIFLIILDKFSFISNIRDSGVIYIQKHAENISNDLLNYKALVFLNINRQEELQKENINLKKQVESFSLLLKEQNNLNINTQELLNINKQIKIYNGFNANIARAIIDLNYLINNKLLIDIGLNKQLKTGLAVINKDGLVGQISIVNRNNAQVILTTNPEFKIYVQTQTSKVKMLATGIGNNRIMVKYIKKSDQLHEGDILVTTGLDDIYPANIPVAKIIKIFYENNGFNSALCEPIVNFNILKYILVMKNANQ